MNINAVGKLTESLAQSTVTELFEKYFKKINVGKNFIEGANIEKCKDAGLL